MCFFHVSKEYSKTIRRIRLFRWLGITDFFVFSFVGWIQAHLGSRELFSVVSSLLPRPVILHPAVYESCPLSFIKVFQIPSAVLLVLFKLLLFITHTVLCCCLVTRSCPTLCDPRTVARQAPRSMRYPGKNTGVGCRFLLQGIFLTHGSNPHLLHLMHCRQILYP